MKTLYQVVVTVGYREPRHGYVNRPFEEIKRLVWANDTAELRVLLDAEYTKGLENMSSFKEGDNSSWVMNFVYVPALGSP